MVGPDGRDTMIETVYRARSQDSLFDPLTLALSRRERGSKGALSRRERGSKAALSRRERGSKAALSRRERGSKGGDL
jgi:hypothetical protein